VAFAAIPAWAGFDEGKAAFDEGDYAAAMAEWMPLAEAEDAEARYYVGLLFRNGWGVLRDDSEAARWWRLTGYQGHLNAPFNLGFMYENGQGVTSDDIEAAKWYRLAAGQGDLDAMRNLKTVVEDRQKQTIERYHLGGSDMSDSPTDRFGEMMHSILGLGETMTPADVGLIALVVLVIMIPVVMPFSFYRIKPLMQKLSDDAAMRDQALLGELRTMTAVLQQQATAAADRDKAQTEELRKITRALDAEVGRHETAGASPLEA